MQTVASLLTDEVRAVLRLALIVALLAPLERLIPARKTPAGRREWALNLAWYFANTLLVGLLLIPPTLAIAWVAHAALPAAITGATAELPLWARMVLAMIVGEVGFYWGHRWSHEQPWLWRFHAVHHSPRYLNFLVNTRAHPVDMVFTRLCGIAPLYALGLADPAGPHPALIPAVVLFVGSLWSFFIHANIRLRLGWLEEVIATPAFHHWHHTLEDHKDHNYASMLPVMDRLFGTRYLPKHWPAEYGASTPVADTWGAQLLDPLLPSRPAPTDAA